MKEMNDYTCRGMTEDGRSFTHEVAALNVVDAVCIFSGWLRSNTLITSERLVCLDVDLVEGV